MSKRKICVVTGTRAEYGLLYWLMKEIQEDPDLTLQVVVTGMHLSPEFGLTYQTIEQDGFHINEKVEMLLSGDTPTAIATSMGIATIGFAGALERLQPDIMVILGDRYEMLAAAQAAMVARIPIAHIHGGETTEGAIDEAIRHSLTKMSHLHFVAAEPYYKRVLQLGEQPESIWNFGAPGLDNITRLSLLNREEFEQAINFKLGKQNFLITYHPVTLSEINVEDSVQELLAALDCFPDAHVILTKSNADTNGRIINQYLREYADRNKKRVALYDSLGQLRYLSAIQYVDAVIGNSSSGLVEVPMFKKATINIGDRQRGRLKATSVIDCGETKEEIQAAIVYGLSREFQNSLSNTVSLYGSGNASQKIKAVIKEIDLSNILFKTFYDLR